MGLADEKQVKLLQEISEDIESVSLGDIDGWQRLAVALEACMEVVGSDNVQVSRLTGLCLEAMAAICEKKVKNLFALIEIMAQSIADMAAYLSDSEGDEAALVACCSELEAALGLSASEKETVVTEPGTGDYSLDDAAAMLVTLEPDDTEELEGLKTDLERYRDSGSCPDQIKTSVGWMTDKLASVAGGSVDDPEEAIAEIGRLIEAALQVLDEPALAEVLVEEPLLEKETESATPADEPETAAATLPEEPKDYMPDDPDLELIGEFITESTDLIEQAEDALLALENDPDDTESVGMIFRAFHTVKGTAAFMELDLIAEMGHHAESLLSRVRDREI